VTTIDFRVDRVGGEIRTVAQRSSRVPRGRQQMKLVDVGRPHSWPHRKTVLRLPLGQGIPAQGHGMEVGVPVPRPHAKVAKGVETPLTGFTATRLGFAVLHVVGATKKTRTT